MAPFTDFSFFLLQFRNLGAHDELKGYFIDWDICTLISMFLIKLLQVTENTFVVFFFYNRRHFENILAKLVNLANWFVNRTSSIDLYFICFVRSQGAWFNIICIVQQIEIQVFENFGVIVHVLAPILNYFPFVKLIIRCCGSIILLLRFVPQSVFGERLLNLHY